MIRQALRVASTVAQAAGVYDQLRRSPIGDFVAEQINARRPKPVKISETSKCRDRLAKYCQGNGIDVGFGGDPIVDNAVTVDLVDPYARYIERDANLNGDARDLYWFADGVLDYVYSSHLLEDFSETEPVVREWLRVLKPGGYFVIYCPDQQAYVADCERKGKTPNPHHEIDDFSLAYLQGILDKIGETTTVYSNPLVDGYSFDLVAQKKA